MTRLLLDSHFEQSSAHKPLGLEHCLLVGRNGWSSNWLPNDAQNLARESLASVTTGWCHALQNGNALVPNILGWGNDAKRLCYVVKLGQGI